MMDSYPIKIVRSALPLRMLRLLSWAFGISILFWAIFDQSFRNADGFPKASICLPIADGIALIILGWAVTTRWRSFAFWFSLALIGQAVALQLVEAGTMVRWQHYKPIDRIFTETNPLLLFYLVAQSSLLGWGISKKWSKIWVWTRSAFRLWQVLGIGLVFFAGAAVQRQVPLYIGDLLFAAFVQASSLGCVILMVWALPEDALVPISTRIGKLLTNAETPDTAKRANFDGFVLVAAIWVTALAVTLGYLSYQWHPHITDEVAYLYQARFLANGTVTLPAPPVPDAFDVYLMEFKGDQWYPSTPPGWPAMLAIGVRLGIPWLVNPALAGLNVLLAYLLLKDLYDRRTARLAVILLCLSPWFVFMAMNYMTHTFTLTCVLTAAVAVIKSRHTGKARWAWLAGGAVGMASLIRPMDGLILAGLIGLWMIGIGGRRLSLPSIAAFALGVVLVASIVFPYNQMLSGSPTVFPLNAYLDSHFGPGKNDLGFGANRGYGWPIQPFSGHSPVGALINADLNTFSINTELFGWSIGSLLFVAVFLVSRTLRGSDYLMIAVCAANFVPYFFYYFSGGPDFGARYWFMMLIPLVTLTVRGIYFLQSKFESRPPITSRGSAMVLVAVLSLSFFALINFFPWRAIDKYHHYWGMRPDIQRLAEEQAFGRSLVLIRGTESHPDFTSAAIYNPLRWDANAPVYAWNRSPEVLARLLETFPDRPVWVVDGPSLTGNGYQVVEGPLPPSSRPLDEWARGQSEY